MKSPFYVRSCSEFLGFPRLGMVVNRMVLACLMTIIPANGSFAAGEVRAAEPKRPLIFVPGLLGSRLCGQAPSTPVERVVWGTLRALAEFPTLRLGTDARGREVRPCGLLREVAIFGGFTQDIYGPVITHLESLGYQEERNLFIFAYDWRLSVFDNAELLAAFVKEKVPDTSQQVDIVAHSLGGLITRVYALKWGGAVRIARLISAGSPFFGSAKVFETLEKGWGQLNYFVGGLTAVRQTVLSFPSILELMPRYSACCDGDPAGESGFPATEADAWRSLRWEGVNPSDMPDLEKAAARIRELQTIVDSALPPNVEDVLIIGVDQRTPQKVGFARAGEKATVRVQTTWAGDGTVLRESAALPGRTIHPTSFADHERILRDTQVQQFLKVALTRGVSEAVDIVKVRPRSTIHTVGGALTQLVGVAVRTDSPAYHPGDKGEARVHIRLGTQDELPVRRVKLSFRDSHGRQKEITLRANRAASDPSNPFEQTFVGQFEVGQAGVSRLIAAVLTDSPRPRLVDHPVAVIVR
jgi:pimeloyl-ACP methyl ester carboxylesterase